MPRFTDERPMSLQVAADLRAQIMSGDLTGQLPPVKALMDRYGVPSNSVIQRAMEMLSAEGFVDSQRGRGNFVRENRMVQIDATPGINLGSGSDRSKYRLLKVEEVVPPADAAAKLGIEPGTQAALRQQVLVRPDGTPVELVWNYYRLDDARGTPLVEMVKIPGGTKKFFAENGRLQGEMDDSITTRPPTTEEVEALELPATAWVLRTLRQIVDRDGEPMEVSVIVKGGHLFGLHHRRSLQ